MLISHRASPRSELSIKISPLKLVSVGSELMPSSHIFLPTGMGRRPNSSSAGLHRAQTKRAGQPFRRTPRRDAETRASASRLKIKRRINTRASPAFAARPSSIECHDAHSQPLRPDSRFEMLTCVSFCEAKSSRMKQDRAAVKILA